MNNHNTWGDEQQFFDEGYAGEAEAQRNLNAEAEHELEQQPISETDDTGNDSTVDDSEG